MSPRDARRPRRRRSGFVGVASALLTLIVLAILAGAAAVAFAAHQFYAEGPKPDEAPFVVESGNGLNTIANRLEEQGFIDNSMLFRAGVFAVARDAKVLPGQYTIPAHASMREILDVFTAGKPLQFFITVPEGASAFQVAERIRQPSNSLAGELADDPAEGTILPGRYDWTLPTETRQSVLDQMQAAMTQKLAATWTGRDTANDDVIKTPADMVVLASMVEKETSLASERPMIASVFINRLRKHMRLQSDPTIIYGITKGHGKLDRPLKKSEVEAKNDYNTYQIDGLPVGPIANPGVDALAAVANPPTSDNLYFVARTADPREGHYFAATYAAHRKNVALYRKAVALQEVADEAAADAAKEVLEAQQASEAGDTGGADATDSNSSSSAPSAAN